MSERGFLIRDGHDHHQIERDHAQPYDDTRCVADCTGREPHFPTGHDWYQEEMDVPYDRWRCRRCTPFGGVASEMRGPLDAAVPCIRAADV